MDSQRASPSEVLCGVRGGAGVVKTVNDSLTVETAEALSVLWSCLPGQITHSSDLGPRGQRVNPAPRSFDQLEISGKSDGQCVSRAANQARFLYLAENPRPLAHGLPTLK